MIFLHLGAHKTGTTAIQGYAEQKLGQKIAVVPRGMIANPSRVQRRDDALELIGAREDALISNEDLPGLPFAIEGKFYPHAAERLVELKDWLGEAQAIYYIRPYASFIESYYVQKVQMGATMSFARWFDRIGEISWKPVVEMIENVFGPPIVRCYADEVESGEFLRRFFSLIVPGIKGDFTFKGRANVGLSKAGLNILLTANAQDLPKKKRIRLRYFLQETMSRKQLPAPTFLEASVREALDRKYESDKTEIINACGVGQEV